jgi:hypothetical protein
MVEINIFALMFLLLLVFWLGIALTNLQDEYHLIKGWPEKPKEQDTASE